MYSSAALIVVYYSNIILCWCVFNVGIMTIMDHQMSNADIVLHCSVNCNMAYLQQTSIIIIIYDYTTSYITMNGRVLCFGIGIHRKQTIYYTLDKPTDDMMYREYIRSNANYSYALLKYRYIYLYILLGNQF